jgi:hypothetical protein
MTFHNELMNYQILTGLTALVATLTVATAASATPSVTSTQSNISVGSKQLPNLLAKLLSTVMNQVKAARSLQMVKDTIRVDSLRLIALCLLVLEFGLQAQVLVDR